MNKLGMPAAAMMALAAMVGCDAPQAKDDDKKVEPREELGQVKLNLSARAASGDVYRLRNGIIMVQGPASTMFFDTEDDPDRPSITAEVAVGPYFAFLQEGWSLEKIDHHTNEVSTVDAQLVANRVEFEVFRNETTSVALQFRVGGAILDMGTFELGIDVVEGGGGGHHGYCRADADCESGQTCCMAGFLGTCRELAEGEACPLPDLTVSADTAATSLRIHYETFPADSCALFEGCVDAAGDRRLLAFATETPNVGQADMILGEPSEDLGFEFSSCHGHYHFEGYARYQLLDQGGNVVRTGHKQAFCLLDSNPVVPGAPGGQFHCGFQGISAGWSDVYGSGLDCQWVDITGLAEGDYVLSITVNADRTLPEANYDNNTVTIPVHVTPDVPPVPGDPLSACASGEGSVQRDCGWQFAANGQGLTCTPGTTLTTGCGCGVGACEGDTVLRVCEGTEACTYARSVTNNDDSCELCSQATFVCPPSGVYSLLVGAYSAGSEFVCEPAPLDGPTPVLDGGPAGADAGKGSAGDAG